MFWKAREPDIETIKKIYNRIAGIEAEIEKLRAKTDANSDQIVSMRGRIWRDKQKEGDLEAESLNSPFPSVFR